MPTLFLCGDVMTGRAIDQILAHPVEPTLHEPYVQDARQYVRLAEQRNGVIPIPVEDCYIWGFALDTLEEVRPAARIINLETAITTSDRFWKGKYVHYRMAPRNIGGLTAAKVDCCVLANNHVLDWGYPGLLETLDALRRIPIATSGAGVQASEAFFPASLATDGGGRILVFSIGTVSSGIPSPWAADEGRPGVAFLPGLTAEPCLRMVQKIAAVPRAESDIVIVSIHWGGNWEYEVPAEQRRFAHRLIDEAGVDIVHGHSSHHVKGIEVHHGRLILYGCGDLINDYEGLPGNDEYRGDLGLMYFPRMNPVGEGLMELRMQPTQMRRLQLSRPSAEDVKWLLETLNREGRKFGTRVHLASDNRFHLEWRS
jgi:poly-gamma-glutamate capsule biosynthesis protein CapA/YwtB (metallophosphatase superfamily)